MASVFCVKWCRGPVPQQGAFSQLELSIAVPIEKFLMPVPPGRPAGGSRRGFPQARRHEEFRNSGIQFRVSGRGDAAADAVPPPRRGGAPRTSDGQGLKPRNHVRVLYMF